MIEADGVYGHFSRRDIDRDMYLVTLEHLLSIKEEKIHNYIKNISTSY